MIDWIKKLWKVLAGMFSKPKPEPKPAQKQPTFVNPVIESDGSMHEKFSCKPKQYDNTYRLAWPSYFANVLGVGAGSFCYADAHRAIYRGQDTDNGANRPKYTLALDIQLPSPCLFELFTADGAKVGEIITAVPCNGESLRAHDQ